MKKQFAVILLVALIFTCFSSCGNSESQKGRKESNDAPVSVSGKTFLLKDYYVSEGKEAEKWDFDLSKSNQMELDYAAIEVASIYEIYTPMITFGSDGIGYLIMLEDNSDTIKSCSFAYEQNGKSISANLLSGEYYFGYSIEEKFVNQMRVNGNRVAFDFPENCGIILTMEFEEYTGDGDIVENIPYVFSGVEHSSSDVILRVRKKPGMQGLDWDELEDNMEDVEKEIRANQSGKSFVFRDGYLITEDENIPYFVVNNVAICTNGRESFYFLLNGDSISFEGENGIRASIYNIVPVFTKSSNQSDS